MSGAAFALTATMIALSGAKLAGPRISRKEFKQWISNIDNYGYGFSKKELEKAIIKYGILFPDLKPKRPLQSSSTAMTMA